MPPSSVTQTAARAPPTDLSLSLKASLTGFQRLDRHVSRALPPSAGHELLSELQQRRFNGSEGGGGGGGGGVQGGEGPPSVTQDERMIKWRPVRDNEAILIKDSMINLFQHGEKYVDKGSSVK